MNTPKAENACKKMMARWVSASPMPRIIMNWGTMYTCQGTAMVAIYARNRAFFPLKCSLENAYAAKLLVSSCKKVTIKVSFTVFSTNFSSGILRQIST